MMTITKGYKQLMAEARAKIRTISTEEAKAKLEDSNVVFVDIRDVRELEREGMIPNAFHAPRGMLEFWVDPESPYHKEIFSSGKEFVLYGGMSYAEPRHRTKNLGLTLMRVATDWATRNNGIYGFAVGYQ
jgi:rhodanese-related sulfurtransferase